MYNFWLISLFGGLSLAFFIFCEADFSFMTEKPCTGKYSCLNRCKYIHTRELLKVVCQSVVCQCIPDGIPRNVTSLIFTGNFLFKNLNAEALEKLTELEELDLSDNLIYEFKPDTFKGQVKLKRLDISDNHARSIPKLLFKPLSNLEELDLSGISLDTGLQLDSDWFNNFTQLRNLSLARNQLIRVLPSRVGLQMPKLKELHLEDNNIQIIIVEDVEVLNSLEKLFLCRNRIAFIEDDILRDLTKLRHLDLDGNHLLRLAEHSLPFRSLVYLNLANTELFIEPHYSHNKPLNFKNSISSLNLNGTYLNAHLLNGFVIYYGALRNLNINNNNLEILTSETFQKLSSLEELRVANNTLTLISDSSLPPKLWSQLNVLDLSGNPFRCDCKLIEFSQWIRAKNFSYSGQLLNGMQCVTYEYEKRTSFPVLRVENRMKLECLVEKDDWFLGTSTAAVFLVSFLSTFASVLHRFRWSIRYWLFKHKIKTKRFKEVQDKKHYTYDAFISYSESDSRWVIRQLLPRLESDHHLRLCIHHRDWLAGRDIAENIVQSIEQSRKTVLIVSNAFAVSQWCHFEMTMAQSKVFQDDRDNLVLVMLEEIADCSMSPRLRMLTERQTYAQWVDHGVGQQLFWDKLGQALAKPASSVIDSVPSLNVFIA